MLGAGKHSSRYWFEFVMRNINFNFIVSLRWFRSPCVTLKECIDQRPENGTDHFSPSFEDFAMKLVIEDASNEARCEEVREELGFQKDHPFDTEVCQEFESYMCDQFFTEVDDLIEDLPGVANSSGITYTPIE
jgi:hypothetical protein